MAARSDCRSLVVGHEVFAGARAAQEQVIASLALRNDYPAAADLQDVDMMHAIRESDRLGQTDSLASIADEHG